LSRSFDRLRRVLAIPLSLLVTIAPIVQPVAASAQTPTAEQLKVFQSLPQEQRDAILQQMGMGAGAAGSRGTPAPGTGTSNEIVVKQPGLANAEEQRQLEAARTRETANARIKGGEQLLIELVLPETASPRGTTEITADGRQIIRPAVPATVQERRPEEEKRLKELRERILKRNPYELSRYGVLQLPGLEPIPLAGLTSKEAQERLALEFALRDFTVAVTLLRVDAQGAKALKPFGYDIFRGAANALVPGTDIPVPDDYKIGPGDTMSVQLYGQKSQTYALPVGRDGTISMPELGPVNVGGMGFGAARSLLEGRVSKQMIGTQARVSLSELRSARVLVLGDAERPGSYVVSSLATATTALFASGGVKPIGSLRNIEVKRDGKLIRRLDLYDVLLKGDTANDVRLQSGDAVFVPPVGPTVAIDGEVRRPAIYELNRERTLAELIGIAGGLSPDADLAAITLERIEAGKDRRVVSLNFNAAEGRAFALNTGDLLRVPAIRPNIENGVTVEGHVHRPGTFAYREGLRLSQVLGTADELKPRADLHYLLVRREEPATRSVSVFSADLAAALAAPGSAADIPLRPRDRISVFDLGSPRDRVVEPLLEEMQRQARPGSLAGIVTVSGRVNTPGRYPLEPGMRVADLLRAGGGLEDAAYATVAELTRYDIIGGERRSAQLREVNLAEILKGDAGADVELQPYDVVTVKQMPEWGRVEEVELLGEVRFPGMYYIRHGESLKSVLERAGGLTSLAFPAGAVFTREELKLREREQLDRLAARLQSDLAALAIQNAQTNPAGAQTLAAGQGLLDQLRATKPVGRLVVNLSQVIASTGTGQGTITLRGGDRLIVPRVTQEVSVLGEVQNPTSHVYRPGLTRDDVIALSGGFTSRADKRRAYVVRADGSVVGGTSRWFRSDNVPVGVGDSVIVPLDAEKMRALPMWTAITTIIYNLAVAVSAIRHL